MGRRVPIKVKVVVKGDEFTVDLTDVSEQVKGFYNSGVTAGYACAQVAFKCLTSPTDYPINDGAFRNLKVVIPMGKVISADAALAVNSLPAITDQPDDQKVVAGQDATFEVGAVGSGTLNYVWRFNGNPIPDATDKSYTHTNSQPGDAGSFSVIVSNMLGAVTSTPAMLIISMPPVISSIELQPGAASLLTLTGTTGDQYTVQFSTNLQDWTDLSVVTNETGQVQFTDPQAAGYLLRFYRVRLD